MPVLRAGETPATRMGKMAMLREAPLAKRFYVVDGHWQIFRAYYAPFGGMRGLTSPAGEPTKATLVFTNILLKLIAEDRPDYLAVALDSGREHLPRTQAFPAYKATRPKLPEDLPTQISRIHQIITAMEIPILAQEGAEADDIMAALAKRLRGSGIQLVLVSRDKDLEQLISSEVILLDGMKNETVDAARLKELKGYLPEQAIEVQSLCGDTVDNIPGIPGVGVKTAAKLIERYGTARAVIEHAGELTPKLAENVRASAECVEVARRLITLNPDVPIDLDLARLEFHGINLEAVRPIFRELGFRNLMERLDRLPVKPGTAGAGDAGVSPARAAGGDEAGESRPVAPIAVPAVRPAARPRTAGAQLGLFGAPPEREPIAPAEEAAAEQAEPGGAGDVAFEAGPGPGEPRAWREFRPEGAAAPTASAAAGFPRTTARDFDYRLVDTPELLAQMLAAMRGVTRLAVDTETTSVRPMEAEMVGLSLSWEEGVAYYLPVAGPLGARVLDRRLVHERLAPALADGAIEKVGHNLKYDAHIFEAADMPLRGPLFDTMLAAYVLDADRGSYALDALAVELLNHEGIPIAELIGKGKDRRRMDQAPIEQVAVYAGEDADLTLRVSQALRPRLASEGLLELFNQVEMALLPVLADMERAGVRVDCGELNRQKVELSKRADVLRDRIVAAAGVDFNLDSPRQLAEVLFDKLKLPQRKMTKTGPSTDVSVLSELAALHEVLALVLEYRQITKLLGTYLEGLAQSVNSRTGRVHTSFNQTGTATGRLSSSDPNLQNIPIRSDLGKRIRGAFVAEEGNLLISADYSQIELRVLAHLCEDRTLMAAFENDQDVHVIVAAEVFGVRVEEVTPPQRAKAKTVNFGIIYGQTAFGLAQTLRIGRREAQAFIDAYRKRFPSVGEFLQACITQARAQGYVETLAGRRRRIVGFDSANPGRRALAERLAINSVVQGSAADLIKIAMINIHRRLAAEPVRAGHRAARMLLQIHDELLFEAPAGTAAAEAELISAEMTSAMKLRVPLKVDVGIGPNWRDAKG